MSIAADPHNAQEEGGAGDGRPGEGAGRLGEGDCEGEPRRERDSALLAPVGLGVRCAGAAAAATAGLLAVGGVASVGWGEGVVGGAIGGCSDDGECPWLASSSAGASGCGGGLAGRQPRGLSCALRFTPLKWPPASSTLRTCVVRWAGGHGMLTND
jgi:hypothetical protein